MGTPMKPYSQEGSNNSKGMIQLASTNQLMRDSNLGKRISSSVPSSAQKRVKIEEEKEISKFKPDTPTKKTTRKAHAPSKPSEKGSKAPDTFMKSQDEEKKEKKMPPIITHVRRKPWEEAKKYEMEAVVQMHSAFYESQRDQFYAQRQISNVLFLRKFNNWVKSILINQTCYSKGKLLKS